jgi:hypothetical protein
MAHNARDNRISRRSWLMASLAIPLSRARASESLDVSFDGDNLRIATPGLHFLSGKPLERLKNADTVVFLAQLSLFSDAFRTPFRFPIRERLVVSYDLWEEKFAVKIPGVPAPARSHLTAAQAENYCIDNLAFSTLGLPPDRPFWMKFELRTTAKQDLSVLLQDSGISLTRMIELLTRPAGPDAITWTRSAGPLYLSFLPRVRASRGNRIG